MEELSALLDYRISVDQAADGKIKRLFLFHQPGGGKFTQSRVPVLDFERSFNSVHTKPESRSDGLVKKRERGNKREKRGKRDKAGKRAEETARDIFRYVNKYKVDRQTILGYKGLGNCCA